MAADPVDPVQGVMCDLPRLVDGLCVEMLRDCREQGLLPLSVTIAVTTTGGAYVNTASALIPDVAANATLNQEILASARRYVEKLTGKTMRPVEIGRS